MATLVACADDPGARALADSAPPGLRAAARTYSIDAADADWRATDLDFSGSSTRFTVRRNGIALGEVSLGAPGRHNVLNALAALVAADERGVALEQGAAALSRFMSPPRGVSKSAASRQGVVVVDDYAHHPTEIKVNLQAARLRYPQHQIWAIWQPHTYSRVKQFWSEFVGAFAGCGPGAGRADLCSARITHRRGDQPPPWPQRCKSRQSAAYAPYLRCDAVDAAESFGPRAGSPADLQRRRRQRIIADRYLNSPL